MIQSPGERAYALAELALQQSESGDPQAGKTIQFALDAAYSAGEETKPFVFEFIAVALGLRGDFDGALAIVDRLDDASRCWPLWNLTEMMVAAGKRQDALLLAQSQVGTQPRAEALLGTATALLNANAIRNRSR